MYCCVSAANVSLFRAIKNFFAQNSFFAIIRSAPDCTKAFFYVLQHCNTTARLFYNTHIEQSTFLSYDKDKDDLGILLHSGLKMEK